MYARKLAEGLAELAALKPTVVIDRPNAANLPHMDHMVLSGGLMPHRIRCSKPLWPQRVGHAASLAATGPYVVHGLSNFNIPLFSRDKRQRRVLTVHDLIPLLAPEAVSPALAWQLRVLFGPAVRAAHRIICVSEWTRRTLVERYPDSAPKIVVVGHGRPKAAPVDKPSPMNGTVQILSVGRNERYKRLDLLVQALRKLQQRYELTIVTSDSAVQSLGVAGRDLVESGRLRLEAGVDEARLGQLYAAAHIVAQPSLYEGYGFPVVEGLAHGCFGVFTRGTAMDETLDRSVSMALEPGEDAAQWAKALEAASAKVGGADWPALVSRAYGRLPTWGDVARVVQKIYVDLLAS